MRPLIRPSRRTHIVRLLLLTLLVVVIQACGAASVEEMFSRHATIAGKGELKSLRGGKVSCMHCPMYFSFEAEPALVGRIIAEHRLQPSPNVPPEGQDVEELVRREANWWQTAGTAEQDKVYWVRYKPKFPPEEQAFRYLVLKNGQAFFITSGHFSPDRYEAGSL